MWYYSNRIGSIFLLKERILINGDGMKYNVLKISSLLVFIVIGMIVVSWKDEKNEELSNPFFADEFKLAVYIDGEEQTTIPSKESGYYYTGSSCEDSTNDGVYLVWDNETWSPTIYNMQSYPTRCNLNFSSKTFCERNPDTAGCQSNISHNSYIDIGEKYTVTSYMINIPVQELSNGDIDGCAKYYEKLGVNNYDDNMAFCEGFFTVIDGIGVNEFLDLIGTLQSDGVSQDDYNELYDFFANTLRFDDEIISEYKLLMTIESGSAVLWKVIDSYSLVDDGLGVLATRLKVVRSSSIGSYSWDTSPANINEGNGVNEWSQADLMKLLNPGYESESIGGSLWWNNQSGNCYNGANNSYTSCDFTNTSLDGAKKYISDAIWHTGAINADYLATTSAWDVKEYEKGSNTGKYCDSSLANCNDSVLRTTTWKGKVGLLYFSDLWDHGNVLGITSLWTISPLYRDNSSGFEIIMFHEGASSILGFDGTDGPYLSYPVAGSEYNVFPTVYLDDQVKIVSGSGTYNDPYKIGY